MPPFVTEEEEEPESVSSFMLPQERTALYQPLIDAAQKPHVLVMEFRSSTIGRIDALEQSLREVAHSKYPTMGNVQVTTLGVVPAEVYDSQRQHYIFLELGDKYCAGDEFLMRGNLFWEELPAIVGEMDDGSFLAVRRKVV